MPDEIYPDVTTEVEITPLQAREAEVTQYNNNISMLEAVLSGLPTEWPDDLLQYRNPRDPHTAINDVPEDRVDEVAQLWFADETRRRIRGEKVERAKATAILSAMQNNINLQ